MHATHTEAAAGKQQAVERPQWLPARIPELDGLRGLAVLAVFFYHSKERLAGTPFHQASLWGWSGVTLFFVLSGFLITSILLEAQNEPYYFRDFYARRALRIWPVYVLVLAVCYGISSWFVNAQVNTPWWAYPLFIQNLFHFTLPPAIGPTWSLAIEEQYYFVWAPIVRFLKRPWMLAVVLVVALIGSPLLRLSHHAWITPTHTLTHLDGIAMGSLIALGLHTLALDRRTWLVIGCFGMGLGFSSASTIAGGTAFLDSALTTGYAGILLICLASTGSRNPLNWLLRRGLLPFYGKISYGLYMTHIFVFIYCGWIDAMMDAYGIAGNLAVIGVRLVACTALAAALWYGFESQILRLKRYF
ncbi:acyltransferase family protein [Terracidiphilus gabretensis]|jgi:peptidoglycan/LPS O-acetylase OafA/YrhL|uniref:acyltransferase family protein n=1 Tax=Terracidiphilus gabretensis TaxID=1577687 RepID=UPI00071B2CFA|nr:acyltransferase [Terracidiphilus gabretensis]